MGYPPTHAGDSYVCLRGVGIAAFDNPRQFVPAGFPADAADTTKEPARCFESEREALDAGYAPAPTPVGSELVDATYLVAPPRAVFDGCQAAANRLGYPVPCPALVPTPVGSPQGCPTECVYQELPWFLFSYEGFVASTGTPAHMVIAGRSDAATVQDDPTTCYDPTPDGIVTVRTPTAEVMLCAEASELNGGHTLARWSEYGVTISVSVHGHTPHERLLVAALATAVDLVEPNS